MPGQALALQGFPGIVYIKRGGIPRAGEIPTPEEWLRYAVEQLEAEGRGDLLRWYEIF